MGHKHEYTLGVTWTGNTGEGTTDYRSFRRDHAISADGKPDIDGSADPNYRGDKARWNPEELLVASLSGCHMLWFLDRAREAGFIVEKYVDRAVGFMATGPDGRMAIARIELSPEICWRETTPDAERISRLHEEAHHNCYIANSIRAAVIVKENHWVKKPLDRMEMPAIEEGSKI